MADSMKCLVGLAGTSFTSRHRATPGASDASIAEDEGPKSHRAKSGSVAQSRIAGEVPGFVGEDKASLKGESA